tara:strand:+ start:134 stop:523 length:390 start_codon:yes stop_codon:yes gene_type:complete
MVRGRPARSIIRQNIIEILYYLGEGYGYDISKIYNEIFPPVTQRSVYYHLRKGVQLQELDIHEIKVEKGNYSWGNTVEKIYYTIGNNAEPKGEKRVKQYIEKKYPILKKNELKKRSMLSRFTKKFINKK